MDILQIKERIKEQRKEKKTNTVVDLLYDYHNAFGSNDNLVDSIQLRMHEIDSLIAVIHASMESTLYTEEFYQKQVEASMHLLEERYDELQIMIDALIEKKIAKEATVKAVA